MVTTDDVRRIALSFPETTEKPLYGTPGFRVRDKAFARLREEGDVLVVWCSDESEKEALITTQPDTFFTLPHYDGYAMVLARLPTMSAEELHDVLAEAWRHRAPRRLVAEYEAVQRSSSSDL